MKIRSAKTVAALMIIASFFVIARDRCFAESEYPEVPEADLTGLIDCIPEEDRAGVAEKIESSRTLTEAAEKLDAEFVLKFCADKVLYLTGNALKTYAALLSCVLLCSALSKSGLLSDKTGTSKAVEFVSVLAISVNCTQILFSAVESTEKFVGAIRSLIAASLPVMAVIYSAGGNAAAAAANSTSFLIMLNVAGFTVSALLTPITRCCAALCVSSAAGNPKTSRFAKTLKGLFVFAISSIMTVVSLMSSYRISLAKSADSLSVRTLRFAGSFVPVVGSAIGESVRTLVSSLTLIKNSAGVIGVAIVCVITLPALIALFLNKFMMKTCAFFSGMLDCEKCEKLLDDVSGIFDMCISVVASLSVSFIFLLTVFINASLALGG